VDSEVISSYLTANPNWGTNWNNGMIVATLSPYDGPPPALYFSLSHPLGRLPLTVRCVLRCHLDSLGFTSGDEIDLYNTAGQGLLQITYSLPVGYRGPPRILEPRNQITYDTTTIRFLTLGGLFVYPKSPSSINDVIPSFINLTEATKWKIRFYIT
jgi:hypothetical protein